MDTAFVVAIVAVVLGGIGLIGGVLGYAQGAAALHRAASARQRATAAEEAALQARFAAEAAARSAEELLEHLRAEENQPRTGPVSTGATGLRVDAVQTGPVPVSRPSAPLTAEAQRFTTGPVPTTMPEPTTGSLLLPDAPEPQEHQPGDQFEFPLARALQARFSDAAERTSPEAARPPARADAPRVPDGVDPPTTRFEGAAPSGGRRPAEGQPADSFTFPVSYEPFSGAEPAPPQSPAEPVFAVQTTQIVIVPEQAAAPAEVQDVAVPDRSVEGAAPAEPEGAEAPSRPVGLSIEALAAAYEQQSAAQAQPGAASDAPGDEAQQDDARGEDDEQPERGSRGQVIARPQDQPPMDWAEVLRTGAIPLPSISRGTYSAPRRSPNPTREGPARFELRVTGRQRFAAVNVGGVEAQQAVVEGAGDDPHLVRPLSARPATVAPGDSLAFSVLRVEGRGAAVQVRWLLDGVEQVQALRLD